jgi:phospho-N-acetylmuramoyl-pentapeptide-transferase
MANLTITAGDLTQILLATSAAFVVAMILAPILTNFLYKNRIGKHLRQNGIDGKAAPIFSEMHKNKAGTPVMGGLLFWVTTLVFTLLFNLSRDQTWLPLFTLVASGLIGAADDLMNAYGIGPNGGSLPLRYRFWIYLAVAAVGAWWFYVKLEQNSIYIPIADIQLALHWWYVPLFIGVVIWTAFSVNETDGLDGLAGGVAAIACFVFTLLALIQGQTGLAVFCATLLGSLLAFLWFNINPARFFMGDTGSMALGMVLPILAFLTNSVAVLPIILIIPYVEGLSALIQIGSKKIFKRKVFKVAPIHHHFEAVGWPETKVTMRFWLINAIGASVGLAVMLVGR